MSERQIPVFLINTVFDERTPEIVARMRHFTGVYCRETPSVERLLAESSVQGRLCPDLTFALKLPGRLAWRPGDIIVVLDTTVASKNRKLHRYCSRIICVSSRSVLRPASSTSRSAKNLVRIARFNVTRFIGKLLPQIYAFNRYSNAITDSHAFLRRLADGTRVVVAARFHGVCFCMKIGVPFLAVASNTAKIEGMLADAGLADRLLDIADLDIDVIMRRSE